MTRSLCLHRARRLAATTALGLGSAWLITGCSSTPPAPDWAITAAGALEQSTQAYLAGQDRVAVLAAGELRREIARSARGDLLARAELRRCAARLASIDGGWDRQDPAPMCPAFEPWRDDAAPADRAYADFLQGRPLDAPALALLPAAQREALATGADGARREAAVRGIADPLSRLVAAAAAARDGIAPPGLVAAAVDTASAQGWRRPLLAWLGLQLKLAERAGQDEAAKAIRRRIDLAGGTSGAGVR